MHLIKKYANRKMYDTTDKRYVSRNQLAELIKRGEQVAEIGSGEFIAKLLIVEEDINKIKVGQDVFIELNTDKNKSYKAILSKVYPFFDS